MSSAEVPKITKPSKTENFHKASTMTCEKFIASIRFSFFKEKYPELHESDPTLLKDTYQQFKEQLESTIKEDLATLFSEKNVIERITALEEITNKAHEENNKIFWRPSGDPNEDIRDHRYRVKLKHKRVLEMILKSHKSQNEQFLKEVHVNHNKILNHEKEVFEYGEQINKKLESLNEIVDSGETIVEGLQSFVEEN